MIRGIKNGFVQIESLHNVVIYGSGVYGKLVYDLLKDYENINVIGWIDRNYAKMSEKEYPMSISSPVVLKNLEFDYIIVAVKTERFIKKICQFIKCNGGKDEQIILIDENEFKQWKKIKFFEDENCKKALADWNDYVYLRDKYGKYVEYRTQKDGEDSGITWLLWFQGWDNAPDIVKKCRDSIKKYGGRKIVCLDEKSVMEYVDIPKDIDEMYKKGIIGAAHYSDIIRLELLTKYGGLWLDATVLLTAKLESFITTGSLFVYQQPKGERKINARSIANWLIYAHSKNLILEETLKLLYLYWRAEKRVINYFAMHFLFRTVSNIYYEEWESVPYYPNPNCGLLQEELDNVYREKRIKQILNCGGVHKLTYKKNITVENSVYSYILNDM